MFIHQNRSENKKKGQSLVHVAVSSVSVQWPSGGSECETVAFGLNNKRWRLTVNWCESWSQMNYAGDKMERWRNQLCLWISYHSSLLSRSIKCCRFALIVLGLIESVNLPLNTCCDQSHSSQPDLTSCWLESSLGLTPLAKQQILILLQFNCNQMSENIQRNDALLATTAAESRSVMMTEAVSGKIGLDRGRDC